MQKITFPLGRILLALPMLAFGIMHFAFAKNMSGILPGFFPAKEMMVYLSGIALIAAGASFVLNRFSRLAGYLLALLLILIVLTIHLPGLANEETMQMAMSGALKDIGLAGGALLMAKLGR